ncbi:glycerophosphodiester phosphodiesterase [Oceanobacillus piezotolerans]|uniref:Glycerophosphodiester phosphodiesterase n=1 Tax=Oceanobacillus piezotolerans TaxID=2448030 RepID=A0A498DD47_9BACI|nr:glycerophosphodiester phosphodiesterase [Oceanobacillus piezotolerans]RLL48142.1 glycerophosphodiester phosphodiesterase [Oceanobacillus piezotolerans]
MGTEIYAHRGASKYAPENTMAAFELAYKMQADGIETDVQLTKDNIPILIHDEKLSRTTNGIGLVKDYTYHELKELDAGNWFGNNYSGQIIPTLEEFLAWVRYKPLKVNIELKNNKIDYKNLEFIVYDMLKAYKLLDKTVLSTFNPLSVNRLKALNQYIEIALLTSRKNKNLVTSARHLGANALHIKYRLLTSRIIEESKMANMKVRVYTVNTSPSIYKSFDLGCNGIFTDVPDIARTIRREHYPK